MVDHICPSCGQTLPPEIPAGLRLTPVQLRILSTVVKAGAAGIDSSRLFDAVYGGRSDGGPESATLKVHIFKLNTHLAAIGKEVRSSAGGTKFGYRGRYFYRDKGERHGRAL